MKTIQCIAIVAVAVATLISCGGSISNQPANADGFSAIAKEIENKFGEHAHFTNITIMHNKSIGNTISLTVTEAPESLKMGQWNFVNASWEQNSEITVEIPEGTKAADFMFQLNEKINLKKLGELTEQSCKRLTTEKDIKNPTLKMAFVKFPKNGDNSKTEYVVTLEPENGGTSFTFYYKLNGDFINMNY
ncbi:hypothetical protein IWQ47_002166 [Aquimarina sp. EL_43]|uniref:hypothetical protein n=1 Tax=Aquimarina TaxID=290174 RepID=UPI00047073AF|nr:MULTISPECIES: hypothetical protein [Aquimarina]MBG6130690.1 hypothetical protein [Aquimarina sp. EL_35]MBG6151164.1 hypothetical protein [Aquimarina sp. EL_32]MBG6169092.1 hypothetical protein [Aquimarina sp. EL_43]